MTSDPSQRPVSPLRARMIEDMTVRGLNERTRSHYVRHVRAFAAFIGRSPDTATAEDLRLFQLHQTQSGMQPLGDDSLLSKFITLNQIVRNKIQTFVKALTRLGQHLGQHLTHFEA